MNEAYKNQVKLLLSVLPDWSIYDYQSFPSIKWKLLNLEKFKKESPDAYRQQLDALIRVFDN